MRETSAQIGPKIPISPRHGTTIPRGFIFATAVIRTKEPAPGRRSSRPAVSRSCIARATVGREAPNFCINCPSVGTRAPGEYRPSVMAAWTCS